MVSGRAALERPQPAGLVLAREVMALGVGVNVDPPAVVPAVLEAAMIRAPLVEASMILTSVVLPPLIETAVVPSAVLGRSKSGAAGDHSSGQRKKLFHGTLDWQGVQRQSRCGLNANFRVNGLLTAAPRVAKLNRGWRCNCGGRVTVAACHWR